MKFFLERLSWFLTYRKRWEDDIYLWSVAKFAYRFECESQLKIRLNGFYYLNTSALYLLFKRQVIERSKSKLNFTASLTERLLSLANFYHHHIWHLFYCNLDFVLYQSGWHFSQLLNLTQQVYNPYQIREDKRYKNK